MANEYDEIQGKTNAKQKSVPPRLWFNPLNCEWGKKYFACTVTSEQANSMQIAYVPETALNEAAAIIERKDREISALRQQVETLRQAAREEGKE